MHEKVKELTKNHFKRPSFNHINKELKGRNKEILTHKRKKKPPKEWKQIKANKDKLSKKNKPWNNSKPPTPALTLHQNTPFTI